MRVASRGVEKAGVDPMKADLAERRYREENGIIDEERVNFPDGIYRNVRERPLFILHYVKATPPKGKENLEEVNLIPQAPVAWGMSLPVSSRPQERVEYVVNTIRYKELFGEEDEDDDQEQIHDDI